MEARSGLDPWTPADLPVPPTPRGFEWLKAVGPGIIVLGVSIGSGEFLLGPAAFVRHGLSLLWVVGVAVLLQTVFNTELMRYTLATGEPVFTGFMRTRPSSTCGRGSIQSCISCRSAGRHGRARPRAPSSSCSPGGLPPRQTPTPSI